MPIIGRYFPSQQPQEKVFLLLRRHWFTYVAFLVIAGIMSIPLFILLGFWLVSSESFTPLAINLSILGASAYFLFVIAVLLYGFIDYYLDVYIVTNERIVDITQDGFFKRSISELYLREVQDVSAQVKGFFPTIMHYGEIVIQTAGEKPNFFFRNVPNPYRISKIIVDLHEAAIEHRLSGEDSNISPKIAAKVVEDDEQESDFQIDLPLAKTARERTKKYLAGGELIETPLVSEALDNEAEKKSDNMLKNIDKVPRKQISSSKKSTKAGEMHENEEIDI